MAENNGMSFEQMLKMYQMYNQNGGSGAATSENTAGQGEAKAAKIVGGVSSAASIIPVAGPIIAGIGSLASGILGMSAASKQKGQAEKDRYKADHMPAPALPKELQSKLTADEMAALGDKPGLETAKNGLMQNFVAHMKAIRESSPTGGHAVNAISNSLGIHNMSLNKLMEDNADYKSDHAQKFRDDLWNLGVVRGQYKDTQFEQYKKPLYQQATALDNSSTANKMNALNTIGGSLTTTATTLANNVASQNNMKKLMDMYMGSQKQTSVSGLPTYDTPQMGQTNVTAPTYDAPIANTSGGSLADNLWNYNSYMDTGASFSAPVQ